MKTFLSIVLTLVVLNANSQIISKFTWDSNPVTKAAIGPDAISVSSAATSSSNGISGTNGLNPGTPTMDINLTLTGSYYDVPGLDVSVYFRREENEASFFKRGSNFNFAMGGGNLSVTFMVSNGAGGSVTVNSGNIYSIPNDHTFHNYHFRYTASTGVANVWVDGNVVYTYTGTTGRDMYWTGAGNAVIGSMMDAAGHNVAVLDNMVIQNSAAALMLPVQLLSFTAEQKNNAVVLNWSTSREVNANSFEVERSVNGSTYTTIDQVNAKGGYSITNNYSSTDAKASTGVNYYRLKMIDIDGKFTYSDVRKINLSNSKTSISVFPNPTTDFVTLQVNSNQPATYQYTVFTVEGKMLMNGTSQLASGTQQIKLNLTSTTQKGILTIQLKNMNTNSAEIFRVVKN